MKDGFYFSSKSFWFPYHNYLSMAKLNFSLNLYQTADWAASSQITLNKSCKNWLFFLHININSQFQLENCVNQKYYTVFIHMYILSSFTIWKWWYKLSFLFYFSSETRDIDGVDEKRGNTNYEGFWFFRTDRNALSSNLAAQKCWCWYHKQKDVQIPTSLPSCPCDYNTFLNNLTFFTDGLGLLRPLRNSVTCGFSGFPVGNWNQYCCYSSDPLNNYGRLLLGPTYGGSPMVRKVLS